MGSFLNYHKGASFFALIGIALAYWIGYVFGGTPLAAMNATFTVCILSVLEVSLSIDNAVVNAKVLKDFDPIWRERFLLWGMLIAVFGMRFIFPLVIVSASTGLMPFGNPLALLSGTWLHSAMPDWMMWTFATPDKDVLKMAINSPAEYRHVLEDAHAMIMGFGGAFLMMVFLKFFIDENKDTHWIHVLEHRMAGLSKFETIQMFITIGTAYVISKLAHNPTEGIEFFIAAVLGSMTFLAVDWIEVLIGDEDAEPDANATTVVAKNGLAGFIYLEFLDASFSFDGVVGAFAMSDNIFLILIGLGIGAFFVRSITIQLTENGTLNEFKYLEHAAFWAIGALATIMYLNVAIGEVPEIVTGLIGAAFLAAGVYHSILVKREEVKEAVGS